MCLNLILFEGVSETFSSETEDNFYLNRPYLNLHEKHVQAAITTGWLFSFSTGDLLFNDAMSAAKIICVLWRNCRKNEQLNKRVLVSMGKGKHPYKTIN